jgi:hypothetical protein
MNITLSKKTTATKKTKVQKRFDKIWRDVKTKQLSNVKLKTELENLRKIYQKRILPIEKLIEIPYTELAQRLIEFFSRKSLAKWQRQELSQWILECIEDIRCLNPEKSYELMASYQQVLADFLEIDINETVEVMNSIDNPFDDLFDDFETDFNDDVNNESSTYQDDLAGFSDNSEHNFEYQPENPKEKDIFSDKWLKTIFRRTANALHPDKEKNEDLRKEKQDLMSQLLTARDSKDVFSLLNLYIQHVDSDGLLITDQTMEKLCDQLKDQKNQLIEDRKQIFVENPMEVALYDLLYSKNKKKLEMNITLHIRSVEESAQEFSKFTTSLRNLKILKLHLSDRYEEQQFAMLQDSPFGF